MWSSFASIFAVTDSKQSSSSSEYSLKMRQKLQDILPRKSMVREYHTNTIFFVTSDPELVVDQNYHSGCSHFTNTYAYIPGWWVGAIIKEVSYYQKTETLTKSVCGIGVGDRGDARVQSSRAYSKANIQYLPHEQVHHQPFLDGLWYLSVFRSWTRLVSVACSKY